MSDIKLSWGLGIDNISSKTNLPDGAVVDAKNVDIDRAGTLGRRFGCSSVQNQRTHSLWESDVRGESFGVIGGVLYKLNMPFAATALRTLISDDTLSYTDHNGDVVASSRHEMLDIAPDLSVRNHGLERPGAPGVAPAASGGLDPGDYGVAIGYMRGNEEGALSPASFVTIGAGQGFALTIPQPLESLPTAVRVYRTSAGDDVLKRAADIPLGMTSFILGLTNLGRQAYTQFTDRMIAGDFVRHWHGMLWCVRGNSWFHSDPLWYGVYSPRFNHGSMGNAIRMFEPVEGGIFVGTKDGVFFLSGSGPKEFTVRKLGGRPPLKNSARRIPASLLGPEGDSGQYVVLWFTDNGFVIGQSDGSIVEHQRKRFKLADSSGTAAISIHNRRATVVIH